MTTRRDFLELAAKVSAAGCVLGSAGKAFAAPGSGLTYGVQMFMVRKQAATDLAGAFRAIKAAGFDQVELYPIAYHQPAAQLLTMLGDTGLTAVSGHFDYTGRDMSVEYAHGLGLKYLVCPMLPEEQKLTLDGFHKAAAYFSEWGESTKKAGMEFVFHNHDYEFKPIGGSNGWTVLMKETDARLVKLEFDLFWLTGQSINLYSLIGLVLLMGIVKKNSILLVEFANAKRFIDGFSVRDAILFAGPVRLRPILMTSLATLAAAVPPALALGPGAESRIPMAITVIGGVIVSTFFTLLVVPCAYSLMARLESKSHPEAELYGDKAKPVMRPGLEVQPSARPSVPQFVVNGSHTSGIDPSKNSG